MADNYLEKQYEAYEARKAAWEKRTQIREEAFPCQAPENGGKIKRE